MSQGYTNRADFAEDGDECKRSPTCQLIDEHGGDCDGRTEEERWEALRAALDRAEELGPLDCPECGADSGTLTPGRLHEQAGPGMLACAACGHVVEEPTKEAVDAAEKREREYQRCQAREEIAAIIKEDRAAQRSVSFTAARLSRAWPGAEHVARSTWNRYCRKALGTSKPAAKAKPAQRSLPVL